MSCGLSRLAARNRRPTTLSWVGALSVWVALLLVSSFAPFSSLVARVCISALAPFSTLVALVRISALTPDSALVGRVRISALASFTSFASLPMWARQAALAPRDLCLFLPASHLGQGSLYLLHLLR